MDSNYESLRGRHILLIGIGFYDYEQAIANELRRQGANVYLYDELPSYLRKGPVAALFRKFKIKLSGHANRHHKKILDRTRASNVDCALIIKGEYIGKDFLEALRRSHEGIKLISYHWDSITRYPHLLALQSAFDKVYTFDRADADKFKKFEFQPLFYRPEIETKENIENKILWDISFIGWLHHKRLSQIKKINLSIKNIGLRSYFYLYTGLFTSLSFKLSGEGSYISSKMMKYEDYVYVLKSSKIILDLPHPDQTGLTMRSIEAIGAGKKLITTALDIVNYDFYNPENILIIDQNHMNIDNKFITEEYKPVNRGILEKYSISSWVKKIFN